MPKLRISAAVAGSAGVACFLRPEPAQPVAMTTLMMAGMNAYVSYICRIRKPQNETSRDSTAMMMMPTLMLTRPSEMAEMHCPPVMQMMTVKPVMLAKLSSTGNDTIYRLNIQLVTDHLFKRRGSGFILPKAITSLYHLSHAGLGAQDGQECRGYSRQHAEKQDHER